MNSKKIVQSIIKKGLKNVQFEKNLNLYYNVNLRVAYLKTDMQAMYENIDYKISPYYITLIETHLGKNCELQYLELSIIKDEKTEFNLYFLNKNTNPVSKCKKTLEL
jgi:hypothetical protein